MSKVFEVTTIVVIDTDRPLISGTDVLDTVRNGEPGRVIEVRIRPKGES